MNSSWPSPAAAFAENRGAAVAGAAAQVALELRADRVLVEGSALAVHEVDRRHDHAGGAIAALEAVVLAEGRLHGVQVGALGEALDGRHDRGLTLDREDRAGLHRLPVQVDHAGAALAGVAADMGAGEAQVLAQELHEQRARVDVGGDGLTVHRQGNGGHGRVPPPRRADEARPVRRASLRYRWTAGRGPARSKTSVNRPESTVKRSAGP